MSSGGCGSCTTGPDPLAVQGSLTRLPTVQLQLPPTITAEQCPQLSIGAAENKRKR